MTGPYLEDPQLAAVERAAVREDFYILADGVQLGPVSKRAAADARDRLILQGTRGIRVLRVVEDYEA